VYPELPPHSARDLDGDGHGSHSPGMSRSVAESRRASSRGDRAARHHGDRGRGSAWSGSGACCGRPGSGRGRMVPEFVPRVTLTSSARRRSAPDRPALGAIVARAVELVSHHIHTPLPTPQHCAHLARTFRTSPAQEPREPPHGVVSHLDSAPPTLLPYSAPHSHGCLSANRADVGCKDSITRP
jgi:hypothetical protein